MVLIDLSTVTYIFHMILSRQLFVNCSEIPLTLHVTITRLILVEALVDPYSFKTEQSV